MNIFSLEGLCHCFICHDWPGDVRLTKLKAKKVQNVTLVRIEKSTEDWEDIRIIKNRIWRNSATAAVFRCPSRGSPVFGTCQGLLFMLTWDQAQFERFSYILCNGYHWNWFRLVRRNVIFKAKRKWSLISGYVYAFYCTLFLKKKKGAPS